MKILQAFVVAVVVTMLQAEGASAVPVALKFSAIDGYYFGDNYRFSGLISYDTSTFQNSAYDVTLRSYRDPNTDLWGYENRINYYDGSSSYIQSAPSASIFRLEDYASDWFDFDIKDFNSDTTFINTITIETNVQQAQGPWSYRSAITFTSQSEKYFMTLTNVHGEYAAIWYAQNRNIYDIPTAATPFWPWLGDDSMYIFEFDHGDITDAGFTSELTPVPEPGTVVLVGAGLLGLLSFARRRKEA